MSGSNDIGHIGNYGEQGIPSESNIPPSRSNALSWIDLNGNFWLFGGLRSSMIKEHSGNEFCLGKPTNDLWIYDGGNWTWMSGSSGTNQFASYGNKGVASPSNIPGARMGAMGWIDNDGIIWMFGGTGNDEVSNG
jgi:hypothetical protein